MISPLLSTMIHDVFSEVTADTGSSLSVDDDDEAMWRMSLSKCW